MDIVKKLSLTYLSEPLLQLFCLVEMDVGSLKMDQVNINVVFTKGRRKSLLVLVTIYLITKQKYDGVQIFL